MCEISVLDFGPAEVAVRAILLVARGHVEVELQGVVAQFVNDPLGLVGTGVGVCLLLGVAVTVGPDFVAVFSAEQLVGRHIEDLSSHVVQGQLDAGDSGDILPGDRALAGHSLDHVLVEAVDIQRVLADDERLQSTDDLRDRTAPVGLAVAGDAGVRIHSDERPRVVPVDDYGLNVGDLHVAPLAAGVGESHRLC
jgi:hypothetical protein